MIKEWWEEKKDIGWIDLFGKERGKFFNRNGSGITEVEFDSEKGVKK